jgi:16S rRNA (guanine966-N2)-methyltransferase
VSFGQGNHLRIIGGRWRGRRLRFPPVSDLRPSPDRVRETVFNWLQPFLPGACCLDLFAGSGALGLEALSRGASSVVLVDRDPRVVASLQENIQRLQAVGATVVRADARSYLRFPPSEAGTPVAGSATPAPVFDVVFLDPPYRSGLVEPCARALEAAGWLAPGAHVYLETAAADGPPALPESWLLVRTRQAGHVGYHLAERR